MCNYGKQNLHYVYSAVNSDSTVNLESNFIVVDLDVFFFFFIMWWLIHNIYSNMEKFSTHNQKWILFDRVTWSCLIIFLKNMYYFKINNNYNMIWNNKYPGQ